LVGWLEGHPACKNLSGGVVIYLERSADFHMAQLMPLPLTVSCLSKIQIGFTFLLRAHLIVGQHSKPIVHFVIQAPNLALHIANIFRYWAT